MSAPRFAPQSLCLGLPQGHAVGSGRDRSTDIPRAPSNTPSLAGGRFTDDPLRLVVNDAGAALLVHAAEPHDAIALPQNTAQTNRNAAAFAVENDVSTLPS